MIRAATKLSRAAKTVPQSGVVFSRPPLPFISRAPPLAPPPLPLSVRSLSSKAKTTAEGNPVALEMINYAISYARSNKSGFFFPFLICYDIDAFIVLRLDGEEKEEGEF